MQAVRWVFFVVASVVLCSCGGGGDSAEPCSSEAFLSIRTSWNSNGTTGPRVEGKLNVPLVATPTVTGIPSSCQGKGEFSIGPNIPGLPAGLSLDRATGVISGTPTQAISVGAPHLVELSLPGYRSVEVLGIVNVSP